MKSVGDHYLPAYLPIVQKRKATPNGERERDFQLIPPRALCRVQPGLRSRHAFGLQSGRRTESILMSLPPLVKWRYDWRLRGHARGETVDTFLKTPRLARGRRRHGDPCNFPTGTPRLRLVPMVKDTKPPAMSSAVWVMSQVEHRRRDRGRGRAKGGWSPWRSCLSISSAGVRERSGQFLRPSRQSGHHSITVDSRFMPSVGLRTQPGGEIVTVTERC